VNETEKVEEKMVSLFRFGKVETTTMKFSEMTSFQDMGSPDRIIAYGR